MTHEDALVESVRGAVRDEYGSHLCPWEGTRRFCSRDENIGALCMCENIARVAIAECEEWAKQKCAETCETRLMLDDDAKRLKQIEAEAVRLKALCDLHWQTISVANRRPPRPAAALLEPYRKWDR